MPLLLALLVLGPTSAPAEPAPQAPLRENREGTPDRGQAATPEAVAEAQMTALSSSVRIYEELSGARPAALSDLLRKPEGATFWPEGGIWWGPLPKDPWGGDYRLADRIYASRDGVAAPLRLYPTGRVAPPNDRLLKSFTAHIQIEIAAAAGWIHLIREGVLPTKPEHFGSPPKDPWGKPYEIVVRERLSVIRVADESLRYFQLEADEAGALQQAAFPPLRPAEEKLALAALERAVADDLAERRSAAAELARFGRPVLKLIEERLPKEKDEFVRRWLGELALSLAEPELPAGWQTYTGGLFDSVGAFGVQENVALCKARLLVLHQLQTAHAAKSAPAFKPVNKAGSAFWSELSTPDDPQLKCPCGLAYRGPVAPPETWSMEDADAEVIVAFCDDEAHGGNALILRKNGDVAEVSRRQPEFFEALLKTKR